MSTKKGDEVQKTQEPKKKPKKKFKIFISKIPPRYKRKDLRAYLHQFGEDFYIRRFANKTNTTAPKISQIDICSKITYDRILNRKLHFMKCGTQISIEKMLEGKELKAKIKNDSHKKISVYGIPEKVKAKAINREFESRFGKIDFCYRKRLKSKRRRREGKPVSYVFISFLREESAIRAAVAGTVSVFDVEVNIKKFIPIDKFKENEAMREQMIAVGRNEGEEHLIEKDTSISVQDDLSTLAVNSEQGLTAMADSKLLNNLFDISEMKTGMSFSKKRVDALITTGLLEDNQAALYTQFNHEPSSYDLKEDWKANLSFQRLRISRNSYDPESDNGKSPLGCIIRVAQFVKRNHSTENLRFSGTEFK